MSETETVGAAPSGLTASPSVPVPNPAFSLPVRRLRGSSRCLNCGTELQGAYCHFCGQPDRKFIRFFPVLIQDLLSDLLGFDSRFLRTLRPLLFHPGRLTRDFLEGRIHRYVPPLRLYLFVSISLFLVAALLSGNAIESGDIVIDGEDAASESAVGAVIEVDTEAELKQVEAAMAMVPEAQRPKVQLKGAASAEAGPQENREPGPAAADTEGSAEVTAREDLETVEDGAAENAEGSDAAGSDQQVSDEEGDGEFDMGELNFNGQPWDKDTNPLNIPLVPKSLNDWLNEEIGESPHKAKQIKENPRLILDQAFDLLPGTMFVLLPVVALLFKFWYLFARRYYIEHLIFALHNHTFMFLALLLVLLLAQLEAWLMLRGMGSAALVSEITATLLLCWIPIYLVVALRTVYRQGWFLTLAKAGVIGVSYLTLIILISVAVAILGFLLV